MTRFEPIAIVGRSCILPGAHTPDALWKAVRDGRDLITHAPEGTWRVPKEKVLAASPKEADDLTWTDRGGYVHGFENRFDPRGLRLDALHLEGLDPLHLWSIHGTREALRDAQESALLDGEDPRRAARTGVILGNLSYPSQSLSAFAEAVWLQEQGDPFFRDRAAALANIQRPDATNRFMSGL
ncbi:MAG: hypothetical protein KAI47_15055, partial [Deltaproteobacteria bacterium]|nr:hypothetical protein [Deltaproteobacteria bacterium]